MQRQSKIEPDFDVIVIGAGFAGLYMLYRLREIGLKVRVFEVGDGVGGTWYWNRYPGARCDAVSVEYSYQFSEELQQDWDWSEIYATQPEILNYLNHVADRFDLRPDIQFKSRVTKMSFKESSNTWEIETNTETLTSKFCVMATGCLSSVNIPDISGLDTFAGPCYHTGNWPHEGVDFSELHVGVIGTGSSAIQVIPHIAEQAKHLYVFQRTANYSVPAHNGPQDPVELERIKSDYTGFRKRNREMTFGNDLNYSDLSTGDVSDADRLLEYEQRWQKGGLPYLAAFNDLLFDKQANNTAAEFIRNKIRAIVHDQTVAEALCPQSILGCKRLCVDTDYYQTYNRANVSLVNIKDSPIEEITPEGLRINNRTFKLDALVFATGFDAMTGALLNIDIRGRAGLPLRQKWKDGPLNYLGLSVAGFPNFFTITGPGSPSVLSNMVPSIEHHVDWIANCIEHMVKHKLNLIEAKKDAETSWVAHVNEVAEPTLFSECNSWYLGANIPGKPRVFMPYLGVPPYVAKCREVSENNYQGFLLKK